VFLESDFEGSASLSRVFHLACGAG